MRNITIKVTDVEHAEITRLANHHGMSRSGLLRAGVRQKAVLEIVLDEIKKSRQMLGEQIDAAMQSQSAAPSKREGPTLKSEPVPAPTVGPSEAEKLLREFSREMVTSLFAVQPPEQRRDEIIAGARAVQRGEISQKHLALVLLWLSGYQPTINTANGFRTAADRMEKGC